MLENTQGKEQGGKKKGRTESDLHLIPQNVMTLLLCCEQQLPDKALQYLNTRSAPAECNTRALNKLLCYLPAHFLLQLPTKSFETITKKKTQMS